MDLNNNRFYLQALGVSGLFVCLLLVLWVSSGGAASEAEVRNANSTRTAIAATQEFLLRTAPTNTPLFIIPDSGARTGLPSATPTSLPELASSNTPIPPQSGTSLPPITPSVTPTPLFLQPGTSVQDPAEFVRWYFGRVWRERDYQNLWDNYLTASYKANVGSGLFEDYVGWWNSVERVEVNSADVIENNGTNAQVRTDLTFHMKDGRVVPNEIYDYYFLYDANRGTWMFDYGT